MILCCYCDEEKNVFFLGYCLLFCFYFLYFFGGYLNAITKCDVNFGADYFGGCGKALLDKQT